jgi:hypothetical protein
MTVATVCPAAKAFCWGKIRAYTLCLGFDRTEWEDLSDLRVEKRQAGSVGFGQEDL